VVLAIVALRGALAACLPGRWMRTVAPVAQGMLILVLLAWFVSLPQFLAGRPSVVAGGGWWRDASPPYWFLGLYETIIGQPQPAWHSLARTACWATAFVAVAVVVLVFALPARRQSEIASAIAGPGLSLFGTGLARRLGHRLFSCQRARASFAFTLAGLARSANHRVYLAAAVGAGLAWSLSGVLWEYGRTGMSGLHAPDAVTLAVQPILVLFLVVAIRFSITIPLQLPANWIFRITEGATTRDDHAGVRAVATVVGLLVVAVLVPFHAASWTWDVAACHSLFGALYVFTIVALFFCSQTKYPFAAAYLSGSIKLKSRWLLYLFGLWALTVAPALLELQAFTYGRYAVLLPAGFAAAGWALVWWRRRQEAELHGLDFDGVPDDVPQSLELFM